LNWQSCLPRMPALQGNCINVQVCACASVFVAKVNLLVTDSLVTM